MPGCTGVRQKLVMLVYRYIQEADDCSGRLEGGGCVPLAFAVLCMEPSQAPSSGSHAGMKTFQYRALERAALVVLLLACKSCLLLALSGCYVYCTVINVLNHLISVGSLDLSVGS